MAWKVERWMSEVFPGKDKIYEEYRHLPPRELVIVSCAVLDAALLELLAKRLSGPEKEIEEFLGANGDGRAPVGSFGARIQLALVTGVLTIEDAAVLRALKGLRNLMAHRVRVDFLAKEAQGPLVALYNAWSAVNAKVGMGGPEHMEEIRRELGRTPEAGEGLVLAILTIYQAYFHLLHTRLRRIESSI